jgi:hypothetical protein
MKHSEFISVTSNLKALENSVRILIIEGNIYRQGEKAHKTVYNLLSNVIPLQFIFNNYYYGGNNDFSELLINIFDHTEKIADILNDKELNLWFKEKYITVLYYQLDHTEELLKTLLWEYDDLENTNATNVVNIIEKYDDEIPF